METIKYTSVTVHDMGRITIPADARRFLEVGDDGMVQVTLTDHDEQFARFLSDGAVTIPSKIREKHGIEDGDEVRIEVSS